jgi:hypothetical protein
MRISAHVRNLVYRGISPNDNHRSGVVSETPCHAVIGTFESTGPGAAGRLAQHPSDRAAILPRNAPQVANSNDVGGWAIPGGTHLSAAAQENEGVGEHVRTRFHVGLCGRR